MRLVHLSSFPAEGVPIRLAGSAQIGGVEIAVTVEHFAEAERDRRGRRAPDVETRPACEILTEVEHRFARWRSMDVHRVQLAHATHRWRHRCYKGGRRRIQKGTCRPVAVVVRRARPAAEFPPRVVRLAAIDV